MKRKRGYNTLKFAIFCGVVLVLLIIIVLTKNFYITYEDNIDYNMYDHIKYHNTDYFYLKSGLKLPQGYKPDKDNPIEIVIVDENGEPMDANRTETAYLYTNDKDETYLLFKRSIFTKDLSLAIQFDHIIYNGTEYYYLRNDLDVPEECNVRTDTPIDVTMINTDGEEIDKDHKEKAYLYTNDEDETYMLFKRSVFTKDLSIARPNSGRKKGK